MSNSTSLSAAIGAFALVLSLAPSAGSAQPCVGDADGDNAVTISELVTAVNNGLRGCGAQAGLVAVSGTIAGEETGTYRVWASGDSGSSQWTDTRPGSGAFTLLLPPDDSYVLGFGHFHGTAEMHFAGSMTFPCAGTETDHFHVGRGAHPVGLGMISVQEDGSFAHPEHAPLDQLDSDGDGIPDLDDPDFPCEDDVDHDHDGFHDDDMDHDGFHDDDMDHDGHHDDGHHGGMHPGGHREPR